MARFSRFRRSAGLLLLASGFSGFAATSTLADEIGIFGEKPTASPSNQINAATVPSSEPSRTIIITPRIIISEEEEDRLLGTAHEDAPAVPRTLAALIMAEGAEGVRKFFGIPNSPVQFAAAEPGTAAPFALDKILTLEMEVTPLQEAGVVAKDGPVLRMSAMTQERMMRHFAAAAAETAAAPANKMAVPSQPGILASHPEATAAELDYEFPDVKSWKQLSASRTDAPVANPAPDTGVDPISADFVQHLPPRGDVPFVNPPELAANESTTEEIVIGVYNPELKIFQRVGTKVVTSQTSETRRDNNVQLAAHEEIAAPAPAARVVSPTMSPTEFAEIFLTQEERNAAQQRDDQVQQTAHEEAIKVCDSPVLRALGAPVCITPCDSETCKGFIIQFGPTAKTEPVAEAQAFDGPAQITLHDGPNTASQGFVWPAQPAAPTESIDELADRLEREFLLRAVSGQLQVPAACPACDKETACKDATAGKSGLCFPRQATLSACPPEASACQTENCPPCGLAGCPNCPAGSPCGAASIQSSAIIVNPWHQAQAGQCQTCACEAASCPPGPCAPHGCPGIAVDSCCPSNGIPSPNSPPVQARSQWSIPTPAITINPYAQTSPIPAPGAGTVLPRDCDFYFRSGVEVPAGPPICGPQVCTGPATFAPAYPPMATAHPQLAHAPQPPRADWTPAMTCPAPGTCQAPANSYGAAPTPMRMPVTGETLDTYREISRTLGHLAERCEAQGLYDQADELRDMAQEYRMSARVVHGHLSAMPLPQPMYGQMPQHMLPPPYAVPTMYIPDQAPSLAPPVAPATYPQPQPLPIAQPMMPPRY
jgi:hypothetical protein